MPRLADWSLRCRLPRLPLLAFLTLLLTAPIAPEVFAEGDGTSGYIARWAVLLGHRDSEATRSTAGSDATDQLIDWDFRRDDEELLELFELASIETLQHGRHRFSGTKTQNSLTAGSGESKVDIEAEVNIEMVDGLEGEIPAYRCRFIIRRGGEVVSAPMVISELGQRAIVASGTADDSAILYVVVDVSPALDEADEASAGGD